MALVAYRAHPLAKAHFRELPPRTPHPRARIMGTAVGACGLAVAFRLLHLWRRDGRPNCPRPKELPAFARRAAVEAIAFGRRGYRESPHGERIAVILLGSFGGTIAIARAVTYVQTQRQPVLPLKKLRQMGNDQVRVHHYVPGIALAFASGSLGILLRDDKLAPWLAVACGTGMGLTLDEMALLIELPHSYWTHEHLAAIQAATALSGAACLFVRISRRGERATASNGLTPDR